MVLGDAAEARRRLAFFAGRSLADAERAVWKLALGARFDAPVAGRGHQRRRFTGDGGEQAPKRDREQQPASPGG